MQTLYNNIAVLDDLKRWLHEDMPFGDITTDAIFTRSNLAKGDIVIKEDGIICGLELFQMIYDLIDSSGNANKVHVELNVKDGDKVKAGQKIGAIRGPISTILKGERLALNLIQRLSGIATKAQRYANELEGLNTRVVDTRKTMPGLRSLEKYAVRMGGCSNHRFSLSDAVMIKDNHIAGAGSIQRAVQLVRKSVPYTAKIEVEIETLDELRQALEEGIDIVMLDNMDIDEMKEAVKTVKKSHNPNITIEASGNMTLERVKEVALTGVDIISVGELTHTVKALDISLKFNK